MFEILVTLHYPKAGLAIFSWAVGNNAHRTLPEPNTFCQL